VADISSEKRIKIRTQPLEANVGKKKVNVGAPQWTAEGGAGKNFM